MHTIARSVNGSKEIPPSVEELSCSYFLYPWLSKFPFRGRARMSRDLYSYNINIIADKTFRRFWSACSVTSTLKPHDSLERDERHGVCWERS